MRLEEKNGHFDLHSSFPFSKALFYLLNRQLRNIQEYRELRIVLF